MPMCDRSVATTCFNDRYRRLSVATVPGLVAAAILLAPLPAVAAQVFFLDFDSLFTGDAADHPYTVDERHFITSEMNVLFGSLGMTAVQTPPQTGAYSTVFFNATSPGTSDGVDFRNRSQSDSAQVNAKKLLEIAGVADVDMTSERIVRASINVGTHEALHLLGARHQDAFALPGFGVSSTSAGGRFNPVYPGPAGAALTDRTLMSVTTLLGFSEAKLASEDLFISPRSAMKAVLGEAVSVTEHAPGNNSPSTSQPVMMQRFNVPNTLPDDLELPPGILPPGMAVSDLEFFADAVIVTGRITQAEIDDVHVSPSHYYAVPITPGLRYTIEVFSEVLEHRENFVPFDTALTVLDPVGGLSLADYYGTANASNRDGFEGEDPAIVDLIAPGGSFMLVEVWSQSGFGQMPEAGDYELLIYTIGIVEPEEILAGDYNGNGIVDAADYTVWRDHIGTDSLLLNDPIRGTIDQEHYDQWKSSFGNTLGNGAAVSNAVPEPAFHVLALAAAFLPFSRSGRRRTRLDVFRE